MLNDLLNQFQDTILTSESVPVHRGRANITSYSSSPCFQMIKFRRIIWMGCIERMKNTGCTSIILSGKHQDERRVRYMWSTFCKTDL